jgi:hypothetical protein
VSEISIFAFSRSPISIVLYNNIRAEGSLDENDEFSVKKNKALDKVKKYKMAFVLIIWIK